MLKSLELCSQMSLHTYHYVYVILYHYMSLKIIVSLCLIMNHYNHMSLYIYVLLLFIITSIYNIICHYCFWLVVAGISGTASNFCQVWSPLTGSFQKSISRDSATCSCNGSSLGERDPMVKGPSYEISLHHLWNYMGDIYIYIYYIYIYWYIYILYYIYYTIYIYYILYKLYTIYIYIHMDFQLLQRL